MGLFGNFGESLKDAVEAVVTAPGKAVGAVVSGIADPLSDAFRQNPENVAAREQRKAQVRTTRAVYGNSINDVLTDVAPIVAQAAMAGAGNPLAALGGLSLGGGGNQAQQQQQQPASEGFDLEAALPWIIGGGALLYVMSDRDDRRDDRRRS